MRIYRVILGFKAIKLYKNWFKALWNYITKKKSMVYELRNGIKYIGRKNSSDFTAINEIFMNKVYHPHLNILKNGGVVIDIGANIGIFSILSAKINPNIKVYSYEPFIENFQLLNENVSINNLKKQIKTYQLGVGRKKETRMLYLQGEKTGAHSIYQTENSKKIAINLISLKDVFLQDKIKECDFLKVDCEGAEFEIVYNAPKSILKRIKTISLEYHNYFDAGKGSELAIYLSKNGFEVKKVGGELGFIYARRKK